MLGSFIEKKDGANGRWGDREAYKRRIRGLGDGEIGSGL
jgi:hypothetical protein